MALLQIAEPGAVSQQRRARKIGVGIDLGTTNSLIAHFDGEHLFVMADESGETALPSVVHYGMNETLVGRSALEASQRGSSGSIASAKRMLGRSRREFEDDPYVMLAPGEGLAFETDMGPKTPVEVSAAVLAALKERAEPALDGPIAGAVITVPAYFDDAQR
ncbi:MAG: Hsp70 family protein, partial [Pseudomonadota bacterium]|nr:Hsp70 family protein [Pseudomonadota bacterium]